jgi:hypothetical protein
MVGIIVTKTKMNTSSFKLIQSPKFNSSKSFPTQTFPHRQLMLLFVLFQGSPESGRETFKTFDISAADPVVYLAVALG